MTNDPLEVYRHAHHRAVAFDLSGFGKIKFTGSDRSAFLQNFTTNDVVKPGPGHGCETFVTTAQAKIVGWLRVAIEAESLQANLEPGYVARLICHLEKYHIAEDVQIEDRTAADSLWHWCGSQLFSALEGAGISLTGWQPWQHACVSLQGVDVWMQRCDFVGLPGVFVRVERGRQKQVRSLLHKLTLHEVDFTQGTWDMLRVEAGTPAYGRDFDDANLPQEIGRTDRAISFNKGCYIGQETVARIRAYGHVNRLLVGVRWLEAPRDPFSAIGACEGWESGKLSSGGKEVGTIKTVIYSPRLQSLLAMAIVRREFAATNTSLVCTSSAGDQQPVEVISLPLP